MTTSGYVDLPPTSGGVTFNTPGDTIYAGPGAASTILPIGTGGQVLTVVGGYPAWTTVTGTGTVTSVAMTVPSFLSVSGSPITGSGTLAVTLSGTALPVANGGTGLTAGTSGGILGYTATGTLASSALLTASQLIIGGGAGATPSTLAAGSQYQVLVMGATTPGYGAVNLAQAAAITGTLPIGNGGTGQTTANAALNALLPSQASANGLFLQSNGTNTSWQAASGSGTVTSVAMTVPTFLSVSGSPITGAGTLAVTLSGTALPILNGGTGATTASAARTGLGLAIGTDVEAHTAQLTAFGAYNTNGLITQTAANTYTGRTITGSTGITITNGDGVSGNPTAAINSNNLATSFGITIDGGGSAITTGLKGFIEIPFACTINRVTMLADTTGSAVVDIWKAAYASFPPTVSNTITASALPTISSSNKSQDSTLTGWTTSVSAGDIVAFNVNSASTITRLNISVKVAKT